LSRSLRYCRFDIMYAIAPGSSAGNSFCPVRRDRLCDFGLRFSGQHEPGLQQINLRKALGGLCIEAVRRAHLGIPELGFIGALSPRPLDEAEKAIRSLRSGLVSLAPSTITSAPSEMELGGSTASQSDFGFFVGYQVMIHGSHRGIGVFSGLWRLRPTERYAERTQKRSI